MHDHNFLSKLFSTERWVSPIRNWITLDCMNLPTYLDR